MSEQRFLIVKAEAARVAATDLKEEHRGCVQKDPCAQRWKGLTPQSEGGDAVEIVVPAEGEPYGSTGLIMVALRQRNEAMAESEVLREHVHVLSKALTGVMGVPPPRIEIKRGTRWRPEPTGKNWRRTVRIGLSHIAAWNKAFQAAGQALGIYPTNEER